MSSNDQSDGLVDSSLSGDRYEPPMESIDVAELSNDQIAARLEAYSVADGDETPWPKLSLVNFNYKNPLLPFLNVGITIRIEQPLPDHSFFYMTRGIIDLRANGGAALATGMSGGAIRVRGDVGDGSGACMSGGTLAIYRSGGKRLGAAMTGGGIFIRGEAGAQCGYASVGGTIVVGGDADVGLGARSRGTTFFVRGEIGSLGRDIVAAPMRKQAQLRLSVLLMNSSITGKPAEFKRFIHREELAAEKASLGEVTPSWR